MATQTITFSKEGGQYVAAFTTQGPFALHIEKPEPGPINMEISSVEGGKYAPVDDFPGSARWQAVVDYEFAASIFPKHIRVTSHVAPTKAVVVLND